MFVKQKFKLTFHINLKNDITIDRKCDSFLTGKKYLFNLFGFESVIEERALLTIVILHCKTRRETTNLVSRQRQGWHLLPKTTILKRRLRLNLMTIQPLIIRVTNARGFLARNVSNHER